MKSTWLLPGTGPQNQNPGRQGGGVWQRVRPRLDWVIKWLWFSFSRANSPAIICGVCVLLWFQTGSLQFRIRFRFRSDFHLRPRVSKRTYWPEDTETPAPLRFRSSAGVREARRFGVARESRWQMTRTSMTVPFCPVSFGFSHWDCLFNDFTAG